MSALFPVFYLGPIQYYAYLLKSTAVKYEINEHFQKQTYRNRCTIYGPNGKLNLVIPVKHSGNKSAIKDLLISNETPWQKIHWKSIEASYRSSGYYEYYEHIFLPYYSKRFEYLLHFNLSLMEEILKILEAPADLFPGDEIFTKIYEENGNFKDLRNYFLKDKKIKNSDLESPEMPSYTQVFSSKSGFKPKLSIIDLLFNLGPSAKQYLLELPI